MGFDSRVEALGLELPPAPRPVGVYKPIVQVDRLVYLSGHGPLKSDKTLITGRVGLDLDVEAGYAAAR
ncbi:MAG: RidA family protein, partial [Planctomycetota bacterium]